MQICFFFFFIFHAFVFLCGCEGKGTSDFIEELEKIEDMGEDSQRKEDEVADSEMIDKNMESAEENGLDAYDRITKESEKRYYDAMEKMQQPDSRASSKGFSYAVRRLYISVYKFFAAVRIMAIPTILISEIIGFTGMWMSQRNKRSKRFFAYTLCIGIPALVLFAVFGYGSLAELFY